MPERLINAYTLKLDVRRNLMPNVDDEGMVSVENAERYFLNLIDKQHTADVVEVVRCKDCKHQRKTWHEDKRMKSGGYYTYWCEENEDPFVGHVVCGVDEEFCSHGERRTDKQ